MPHEVALIAPPSVFPAAPAGGRVLVIDDDESIRALLRARLAAEGITTTSAEDGPSGLAAAVTGAVDAVLLDVDMPGLDGYEVCRRLKADPRTAEVPVIFLTGDGAAEQKVRGLDLGALDYVTKPFDVAELKARVRVALRVKRMHDLLAERAMVDGLTGLWNRAYFDRRLAAEWADAARHGRWLAVVMADVDHFKAVNDRHGHPVGDDVLRHVAAAAAAHVRPGDVACRYGGEEFAVIAPGTDLAGAAALAERLRAAFAAHGVRHGGRVLGVTASLGAAACVPGTAVAATPGALMTAADAALYAAKRGGRDRVVTASTSAGDQQPAPEPAAAA